MDQHEEDYTIHHKQETIFTSPIIAGFIHDIYIMGEIGAPENYIREFDLIRKASEEDIVNIHLNTVGGRLDTAIQFIRVMEESKATLVTSIEGYCMSAGTMIFLKGDHFQVSDHSIMQCHNYSGGMIGKGHEMYAQAVFEKPWSKELLQDIYEEFLTSKEIDSIIAGTDVWLTSKEVDDRCTKLLEYRIELQELMESEKQE